MTRRFTDPEALLDYVRGRLEGLTHTVRMPVEEKLKQELLEITQMMSKYLAEWDKQRYDDLHK